MIANRQIEPDSRKSGAALRLFKKGENVGDQVDIDEHEHRKQVNYRIKKSHNNS